MLTDDALDPERLIAELGMSPHPEGGHYVETWRAAPTGDGRASATAIHFLLRAGESSHWHRVDADELWIHNAGGGLTLSISEADGSSHDVALGTDLDGGDRLQALVRAGAWQAARPRTAWALVTCVVSPGFEFGGFELAPADWSPG